MTDFEKLTSLLNEWGVGYSVTNVGKRKCVTFAVGDPNVEGYNGLQTDIYFMSEDESFYGIEIWEE